ncbi:endonuclease/exonuclease/phosphatase family protein [Ammoniphilus sp. CFH 90114]|uniref:endonuclease/exonuclease/phosphatase family protein n=1 Tax=Ammoniphilus sp. CFH 90114 TaxID=2493665 RepID=UPI00100FC59B|nr:endonuclease/exonuclease/phosphatase family protein [Ammoniphilus sp. CFH 90114]RXT05858.1 hypothetical protein EIZ39_17305 [Ammoniphilus sp. CFH 90114]
MQLNIICYNIHSGRNLFYRPTLDLIIQFLKEQSADIISLQEVHHNSKQGWQFDQIMKGLAMDGSYGANVKITDGAYGNATFSRYPIVWSKNVWLPSQKEQRGMLHSVLEIQRKKVHIFNTHLGLGKKEREMQLEALTHTVEECGSSCLLMGDLNTTVSLPFPNMIDLGKKAGKESQPTIFPLKKRIDYIYASSSFELLHYEVNQVNHSDHYPIKATVQLVE